MGSDSAQPRVANRTKLPDDVVQPPGPDDWMDELVAEHQVWEHRDAGVVPVQMLDQLSEHVAALTDVDPCRLVAERIDARLLWRVQNDRGLIERIGRWIPPRHPALLSRRCKFESQASLVNQVFPPFAPADGNAVARSSGRE